MPIVILQLPDVKQKMCGVQDILYTLWVLVIRPL